MQIQGPPSQYGHSQPRKVISVSQQSQLSNTLLKGSKPQTAPQNQELQSSKNPYKGSEKIDINYIKEKLQMTTYQQQIDKSDQQANANLIQDKEFESNNQIVLKIKNQEILIKSLEQKINQYELNFKKYQQQLDSLGDKILLQDQQIQKLQQTHPARQIQEQMKNFFDKNDQAHEIWKKSAEKINKIHSQIEIQSQDLDKYKQQIEFQLNEYNKNMSQLLNKNLKEIQERIQSTQFQTDQSVSNIIKYEQIIQQFCEQIHMYQRHQGIVSNQEQYCFNNQVLSQDLQQLNLPQQQVQQPIYNANQNQQQQSYTINNIYQPSSQFNNNQDLTGQQQNKTKIRLISTTQTQEPQ